MTKDEAIEFLQTLEADDAIKDATSVLEALKKTREEAKTNREALEEANTKIESLEKFKGGSKANAISAELKARGVKNPERISKILDVEKIEFNEDGLLDGFDEQFELANTEWPELFDNKRRAGNVDQFKDKEPEPKLSATQIQLQRLHEAQSR